MFPSPQTSLVLQQHVDTHQIAIVLTNLFVASDNTICTVNNESLESLKFGKSGSQTFWRIKVLQIYHEVNLIKRLVVS